MHNGIAWSVIQRIMIDLPSCDYDSDDKKEEIKLNTDNADNIMTFINNMI